MSTEEYNGVMEAIVSLQAATAEGFARAEREFEREFELRFERVAATPFTSAASG